MKRLLILSLAIAILAIVGASVPAEPAEEKFVRSVRIEGEIGAGTADFIERAIQTSELENVPLIIELDTPGGILSATEEIVDRIWKAKVKIVGWVTPAGAWAYSAGTYILLITHVAAMDEGTCIGAAQPRPEDPKVTKAAAKWMESIAEYRHRPPEIARSFVENNETMGPEKALSENVIDLVATRVDNILAYLGLEGAKVEEIEPSWVDKFLNAISNSQIVMILFILGFFGLIAEITTPGIGFPGVAGVICLLLSLWGMMILKIYFVGVALMALGMIMLAYEILTPGFGVFGGGGIVALVLGLMLIGRGDWPNIEPWIEIAGNVTKGIVLGIVGILGFAIVQVRRVLRKPPVVGKEELIGKVAVVTKDLDLKGLVKLRGELWTAVCEGRIEKGEEVVVKNVKGSTLIVEKRETENENKKPSRPQFSP